MNVYGERYTLSWYRCSTASRQCVRPRIYGRHGAVYIIRIYSIVLKTISIYTSKSYKTLYTSFMFHTSNHKFIVKVLNWSNWNKIVFECIMGVNNTLNYDRTIIQTKCLLYWMRPVMFYLLVSDQKLSDRYVTIGLRRIPYIFSTVYLLYAVKRSMNFQLMTSHWEFIEKDSRYIANII